MKSTAAPSSVALYPAAGKPCKLKGQGRGNRRTSHGQESTSGLRSGGSFWPLACVLNSVPDLEPVLADRQSPETPYLSAALTKIRWPLICRWIYNAKKGKIKVARDNLIHNLIQR